MDTDKTARIRALNDRLRQTGQGGRLMATTGVLGRGADFVQAVVTAMRSLDAFAPENDPYHEHDFGSIEHEGARVFWKIDYYDQTLTSGAEDPGDEQTCCRVLTLMLAEEY